VDEIEIDGSGAINSGFARNCANRTYEPGAVCAFEVVLVDGSPGEETEARLVIHQDLPGNPSYVDLVGVP